MGIPVEVINLLAACDTVSAYFVPQLESYAVNVYVVYV